MKHKSLNRKQYIIIALFILLVISLPALYFLKEYLNSRNAPESPAPKLEIVEKKEEPAKAVFSVPEVYNLVVPYTVQAPGANWKVHEESCEEAAILMYHQYLLGVKTDIDPVSADRELRAMKSWQVKNYGVEPDLSIARLAQFVGSYYGDKAEVIPEVTAEVIKSEVAAGQPVLVPVMTQSLKNPHYSPGNSYHILVIKGYDATGVITNDAGVKEGKDWRYSWEVLFGAIDAANIKINQGRPGLIITAK